MLSEHDLKSLLSAMDIPVTGVVIPDFEAEVSFVFVNVARDRENKQRPSNLLLNDAKVKLASAGATVEFLLVNEGNQDIEAGLRATLRHSFDSEIRNIFLSWEGAKARVWIEPKCAYDDNVSKAIFEKVNIYLSQINIDLESIIKTTGENIPTIFACLNRIRYLAPVTEPALLADLISHDFSIPSADWLRRRLDSMRRADRIVRLADGAYALTLKSLRALGTIKGRDSPDIKRMLALARRGE